MAYLILSFLKYRHAEDRSAAGCRSGISSADRNRQAGNFADLQKEFAAIIVCVGSTSPRRLKMIRDDAKGVYYAKDFLTYVTKEMLEQNTSVPADTAGKDVVIIGGGDTGIDCAAVAFAQGARSILQLELRECEMTGKTQDGFCELVSSDPTLSYGTMLQDVLYDDNGFVKGVRIAKVEWISSASGSLPKPQLIEGSESEIPAQLLLLATGFTGPEPAVFSTFAFNKTPVGTIAKGSGYFDTSRAGVFAAGDARRGQGVVEWAFAEGRNAAVECAEYLHALKNNYTKMPISFYGYWRFILLINASEFLNKNSRVIKIQRKNVFIYFKIKWNI